MKNFNFRRNMMNGTVAATSLLLVLTVSVWQTGFQTIAQESTGAEITTSSGPTSTLAPHEDLDATLWMRTSAEYHVLAVDAYRRALTAVRISVKDPGWSALREQERALQNAGNGEEPKLPAVILDVDETVLDNSAYQVECITTAPFQFTGEGWTQWCNREMATPVPGVMNFVKCCREKGVAIRYVTNRGKEVRQVTLNNLRKLGLVPDDESGEAELLCKGDRPDWGSDKTNRREFIAEQFRVVAIIGDDLNDFTGVELNATPEQRMSAATAVDCMWGTRWFLLPNANYGGWEKSLVEYKNGLTREAYIEMKRQYLLQPEPAVSK